MSETLKLPPRYYDIVLVIKEMTKEKGYAPSWQEIATALAVKFPTLQSRMEKLKEWGVISWKPNSLRTTHLTGLAIEEDYTCAPNARMGSPKYKEKDSPGKTVTQPDLQKNVVTVPLNTVS